MTGFTGFMWSRIVGDGGADAAAAGGGAVGVDGVDDGVAGVVGVETGGVVVDGPLICGVGDCVID